MFFAIAGIPKNRQRSLSKYNEMIKIYYTAGTYNTKSLA